MQFAIKLKKSAGVRVTSAVHRLISQGNRLRGADWEAAANAYRRALDADPALYHIWLQLGHAQAEAGAYDDAIASYLTGSKLRPDEGEPWLHMGHASKRSGNRARAARFYIKAFARRGVENEAATEAERLIHAVIKAPRSVLQRLGARIANDGSLPCDTDATSQTDGALKRLANRLTLANDTRRSEAELLARADGILARLDLEASQETGRSGRPIVFDVTDLVAHFRHHRLPTGIQRVQIEVIATALNTHRGNGVSVCCFIDGRDYWIGIPGPQFLDLAHLASSGSGVGDTDWQNAVGELFIRLATDDDFTMPMNAILVNLGTSWWIYDYYRLIRNAKLSKNILYIPFIHDFIPIMAPEHCVSGVTGDYVSWLVGVFQHADFFLVNSVSTRCDLIHVAERLGHVVSPDRIEVVTLDADFRSNATPLPESALTQWGLEDTPFALLVSTIESRKNHVLAFDTWAQLIRDHGAEKVPRLVCVGRNGWLNDRAFERLAIHKELRERITIINHVSDGELALLYRSCRFTIYPSHYEGWGLPVTESLCYGRVPVIADNSSLPEAGAGFAEIFASDSISDFARAVAAVAFDEKRRKHLEDEIAARFKPRSWRAVADQIGAAIIARDADEVTHAVIPQVVPGRYYPTRLYREPVIWKGLASGEIFRTGEGWLWPETSGCRTRSGGGEFYFALSEAIANPRLYLRIAGLGQSSTRFTVFAGETVVVSGLLDASEIRWVTADLPEMSSRDVTLKLSGLDTEQVAMNTGGSVKFLEGSIALVGFVVCDRDDEAQRARFMEVAGFGDIDEIDAYRRAG